MVPLSLNQISETVTCECRTCGNDRGQHLLRRLGLFLWCGQLLLQVLQGVLVLQQVPGLQVVDVQRQVLAQDLDFKLEIQLGGGE